MQLSADQIERVVVRGANWVGDAVMTVPALRELRRVLPHAQITLATRPWARDIFDGADFIDDLLVIDEGGQPIRKFIRQVRQWRAHHFDLAVLLPNAMAPALVAAAARVPVRVGYATQSRGEFLTHAFDVPAWRSARHEVFYYLNLVAELERTLNVSAPMNGSAFANGSLVEERAPQFALNVSAERQARARELLEQRGVAPTRPLVALCPGSTNSRAKRWHAERFAAVADRLIEEAGATVVLVGAREELDVTQEVVAAMQRAPVVLTGETSLAETTAILSLADLLVTNDTGPAHLAPALGTPTLVVFGPTNPLTTRPFAPSAEIIRRPPDCAPCMLRDCPIDHRCMTAITVEDVFARAVALLEQRRGRESTNVGASSSVGRGARAEAAH
jgi:heptosyltransferase-2